MELITKPVDGDRISALETMYPTDMEYMHFAKFRMIDRPSTSTSYIVCFGGTGEVISLPTEASFTLREGNCCTFTGPFSIDATKHGVRIAIMTRYGYRGMLGLTKIENRGRLTYIDGCTDSLLFGPHRMGDPCLNSLHFPIGTKQTQHLHPDIRMGVVLYGEGVAFRTGVWEKPLLPGSIFNLPEGETHSFETGEKTMTVVAYHPTTDTGPTDDAHPMKSRTYIGLGK